MSRTYTTTFRCGACVAAVAPHLDADPAVGAWSVDLAQPGKPLTVAGPASREHVGRLLERAGYQLLDEPAPTAPAASYFPLALIGLFLVGIVAIVEVKAGAFDAMRAMRHFMAGFFLAFAFFKLLDVRAFADGFAQYDLLAARWRGYGLAYPFAELALGVLYLADVFPRAVNAAALVLMLVGAAGVVRSLMAKRAIRCACLGAVFNLPMSTVTLAEDALMAGMAAVALLMPAA